MYPSPRLISAQAVILASFPGKICMRMLSIAVLAAALATPSKNLEGYALQNWIICQCCAIIFTSTDMTPKWTSWCCRQTPGSQRGWCRCPGRSCQCCRPALARRRGHSGQRWARIWRRPGWQLQRRTHTTKSKKSWILSIICKASLLEMVLPLCPLPLKDRRPAARTWAGPSQNRLIKRSKSFSNNKSFFMH